MGNGEEADTHPPATPRQIRRIQLLSIIGDLSVIYNVYAWHTDAERMATKSSHWPCPPAAQLHRPFQLEFIRPVILPMVKFLAPGTCRCRIDPLTCPGLGFVKMHGIAPANRVFRISCAEFCLGTKGGC